ncbi:kinase-like protein [Phanerochaete sordida]|uniref:Kinase-like protein n=1 Tax=Phanerochaete sordida TaxID=48140 RepID=A0A9P3GFX1_9APHY|nr:kinase-like protein [Phanerochaete sordida]
MSPRTFFASCCMGSVRALDSAATSPAAAAAVSAFVAFGDCSNVPAVAELSKAVQAFQQRLVYSKRCPRECTALANKCGQWAQRFTEWLEDEKVDEGAKSTENIEKLIGQFHDMMLKVTEISSRSRWKLLWGAEKVKRELKEVERTMKHLFDVLKIKNRLEMAQSLDEANALANKTTDSLKRLQADRAAAKAKPALVPNGRPPPVVFVPGFAHPIHQLPRRRPACWDVPPPSLFSLPSSELAFPDQDPALFDPARDRDPLVHDTRSRAQRLVEAAAVAEIAGHVSLGDLRAWAEEYAGRVGGRPEFRVIRGRVRVLPVDGTYRERTGNPQTQVHVGLYCGTQVVAVRLWVMSKWMVEEIREPMFCALMAWGQLDHPNILPLLGVTDDTALENTVTVAPWMRNGNAVDYCAKFPGDPAVRLRLLIGMTEGLAYMHELGFVHGNMKGRNVLVSDEGEALIDGFRRAKHDADRREEKFLPSQRETDVNWTAPELRLPTWRPCAKHDVFAAGMVAYELFTGCAPYHAVRGEGAIFGKIFAGELPPRPRNALLTDEVWGLLQETWTYEPDPRPTMRELGDRFRALLDRCEQPQKADHVGPAAD